VTRPRGEGRALVRRHPAEVLNATVVELALDCIISIDHEGRIIEFNPAAERTFGYARADVLGKLMAELIIPPHLRRRHYAGMRRYLETGEAQVLGKRLELEAMRSDGSVFPVELAIVRVPLPGEPVFISYLRDLTVQQRATEALREKTDDALHARDEAFQANKAKSQFLAAMSHELRTPLNAITGYIELLMLGVHGVLAPEQLERLGRVKRSADHLSRLINDVLSFARLEAGRVTYEIAPVGVDGLMQSAAEVLAPQMASKSVRYVARNECGNARVQADREKALQILINLLSNAVKHAPPMSEIVLGCTRSGATLALSVRDAGRGIPAEKFDEIFRPFTQLEDAYVGDRKGTGLGLAISREMARAMKGEVTVESAVGAGATFTLTLPASEAQ
jgi:two-component system sensor histidine kinase/response regulator